MWSEHYTGFRNRTTTNGGNISLKSDAWNWNASTINDPRQECLGLKDFVGLIRIFVGLNNYIY